MNKLALIGVLSVSSLVGCAATPASEDAASGSSDIVGITDLGRLEEAFGLVRAAPGASGDTAALQNGECYRALIATPSWQATYEFRRYVNGAAFWAKLGSGYNSGDQRPIVCVDTFGPNGQVSFSGVALDAVLRYDLGAYRGSDSGMMKTYLTFERGAILLSHYDVTDQERTASVQKRPHELPFENASTIEGRVMSLTLKGVNVDHLFGQPAVEDMEMPGSVAQLVYRYAWHKNEETGRFTIADDAMGPFLKKGSTGGDGGASSSSWSFARGSVYDSLQSNMVDAVDETIALQKADHAPTQLPLAECVRTIPQDQGAPAFNCTGL